MFLKVALLTAAFVAAGLALACSKDKESPPVPPPPALWAAFTTSPNDIGLALRVTPGTENEPWRFDYQGDFWSCVPEPRDTGWRFKDCADLPYWLRGFSAEVPATPGEAMRVTFDLEGRVLSTRLARIADRDEPRQSENVDLVWSRPTGEQCGSRSGVWAEEGVVFSPCSGGIIEVLDAKTGELLSTIDLQGLPSDGEGAIMEVTARTGVLYAATTSNGVVAFDVRDPANPRTLGSFFHDEPGALPTANDVTNIHTLTLSPDGRLLFAINQSHASSDIRIIDISDPARMREVGVYLPPTSSRAYGSSHDISLEERDGKLIGYFYQLAGGFHILDASDPANVREVGRLEWPRIFSHSGWPFEANGRRYLAHADEGYDQGLTVIDVTNIAEPKIVSTYQSREGTSIHNLRVIDNVAYISYYLDGLRIVDLHDPAYPREIGHYDTVEPEAENHIWGGAWGVHVADGLVFISDRYSGIYAFRFTGTP